MLQNEKNSAFKQKPLILFGPLDWGWGHTTRCIPILRAFQDLGCELLVACNSTQKRIIESEIYGARYLYLEGYNIEYGPTRLLTRAKIFSQLNKILMKVNQERLWLKDFLDKEPVSAVISDNRYGLCSPLVPSILITHQLQPRTGLGAIGDAATRTFLYRFVNQFSQCWVPDQHNQPLAGTLSHPAQLPAIPVNYIGILSRIACGSSQKNEDVDVLALISGPEPQRTILEQLVTSQLNLPAFKQTRCVLVRGVDAQTQSLVNLPENTTVYNHADANTLSQLVARARVVLCRSGYTSLMEMVAAQKKMIVIPTPGQTEQEYLARHFANNNYALAMSQKKFSLAEALQQLESKTLQPPVVDTNTYKHAVNALHDVLTA